MQQKRTFGLICFYLVIAVNLLAQSNFLTISGVLLEENTKLPLPYASIYLQGTSIGTTSNTEGAFIFHIPKAFEEVPVVISMIGYQTLEQLPTAFAANGILYFKENILELGEVVVTPGESLSSKQIIKKAYRSLDKNYPSEPYLLEGFLRDLQKEDSAYVELQKCAIKLQYAKYDVKASPKVELQEVRRSYISHKHPWNEEWDRKNSIVDLIEDDFIRFDYGPIKGGRGWKYETALILPFGDRLVYQIKAVNGRNLEALFYIDVHSFAFVRIAYTRSMHKDQFYKRRLSNGQQEVAYHIIFEYQEYQGKWYLKYQKEEDTWRIYKDLETNELLFTKYPKKELFINKIVTKDLESYPFSNNLKRDQSIEVQATPYDADFWKHYNAPAQTKELSIIETYLQESTKK